MTTEYNNSSDLGSDTQTTVGTVSAGTWHASTVGVQYGGTGNTTFTAYSVICAGTTATGAFQNVSGLGTTNYVLTSNGAGALPTWQAVGSGGTAVTSIAGTANQITASASTGAVTLSIPSTFIAPGTVAVGNLELTGNTIESTNSNGNIDLTPNGSGIVVLANAQVTDLLASELVYTDASKNLISVSGVTVPFGGTGESSFTAYSVICAGTTSTGAFTNVSGLGTSGYVLTSNGAGAYPTWQANAAGGDIGTIDGDSGSMTGTTVTISGGSTGLTTSASSAAMNLTGTLNLASGGTNHSLTASNGGIVYSDASKLDILSGTSTANQVLLSGSSTAPAWSTATYPATTTINQLLYSSSNNVITGLATTTTAVLTTSSGVPTWASELSLALGGTNANLTASNGGIFYSTASAGAILAGTATAGQLLTSGASTTPAWTTSTYPATNAANTLLYASSANTMAALTAGANGVLISSNSNVPSWLANGTAGYVLTANSGAPPSWQAAAGGSGSAVTLAVAQTAHGFSVGNVVYYNGSAYALAKADTATNAEAVGIVTTVTDANDFIITTSGYIPSSAGITGLTAGDVHWLSDGTAGLLTTTQPATVGHVQKPLLVADSTTSGFVINFRGEIIPASAVNVSWTPIAVNTNMTINSGYYITGGSALTFTLPVTAAAGSVIWLQGYGSTSWTIAQNASQNIYVGNTVSTTGTGGSVASNNAHDGIYLLCTVANTTWQSTQFQGFLTVT